MQIGKKLETLQKQILYKKINAFLKIENPLSNYKFIGNHPVSLTNDNIILLLKKDYMVCEKSDGVRMLLIVFDSVMYFYDRKNDIYEVSKIDSYDCMLDGELFRDNENNFKYGIFDCLAYNNELVLEKNLLKRLYFCEQFIMQNEVEQKRSKISSKRVSNIELYVKSFFKSYGFLEIYNQIRSLKHKNDGLIFTPVNDKYILYVRGTHLKWKPPSINTIDFKIEYFKDDIYALKCTYKNNEIIFDYFFSKTKNLNGKIGEFVFDKDKKVFDVDNLIPKIGGWDLYKIRDDKESPNHYRVVNNILESLDDNLDIEELSRYYKPMRNNFKLRESKNKVISYNVNLK